MNFRRRALTVVSVVVAGVFLGWLLLRLRSSIPDASSQAAAPILQTPAPNSRLDPKSKPEVVQPFARTPFMGLSDPRWAERRRLREEDKAYEWKTPIEFYGKVIDEQGQPVAGATVEISWSGTVEKYGGDGVGHRTLSSDAHGLIEIKGIEGKGMTVRVSKEGYYTRKSWGSFEYAGFWEPTFIEPDRNNPVTFHLVKRPVAEPTYHSGGRVLVQPPALETHLDLLKPVAQSLSPADLYVKFVRPPDASHQKPFDWSIAIEGRNGAELAETADEFMLRAPAEGYKAQIIREYKQSRGNARNKVRFYVRSTSRKFFAAVDFEVVVYRKMAGSEPASIMMSAIVNPNDSPNLAYDPEKDIRETAKK